MHKVYPLGHKSTIKLLSLKGKKSTEKTAKIIILVKEDKEIQIKPGIHLAFATSKKRFPKAVTRNRIKRRFRAALHQELKQVKLDNKSILILIIPHQRSTTTNFKNLKQDLSNSFKQSLC